MYDAGAANSDMLKRLLPAIITLMLTGFAASIPMFADGLTPMLCVLSVLVFTLYTPSAMPLWAVVVLSLVQDVFSGAPIGLTGCALLLVLYLLGRFARALQRQPSGFIWLSLAAGIGMVQLMMMLLLLITSEPMSVYSAFSAWAFTLVFIPVMQPLVARVFR